MGSPRSGDSGGGGGSGGSGSVPRRGSRRIPAHAGETWRSKPYFTKHEEKRGDGERGAGSFQKVMSHGTRWSLHSMVGLLSILHDTESKHKLIVDSIVKTGYVLSTLMDDIMEKPDGYPLETRPFGLHALIKEASCVAKCLCMYKGFGFLVDVQRSFPDRVMGDEKRTFQVILHMVGCLLDIYEGNGSVTFRVVSAIGDGS